MKYFKKKFKKIAQRYKFDSNEKYLSQHPEMEQFEFPQYFYFRCFPERSEIHWAIIKPFEDKVKIYFINNWGRVFDELEYKNKKIAQRRLRKNGFDFSTNVYCPFLPPEPIYIKLSNGKKSAPYSKGDLWQSVQRNSDSFKRIKKTYSKEKIKFYKKISPIYKGELIENRSIIKNLINRIKINFDSKMVSKIGNFIIAILFLLALILSLLGY